MLPLDSHHLSESYHDIKWKRSICSHISAVMLTHRVTVHQKFSTIMSQLDRVWRQSRLSNTTKFCIYNSRVLPSLLEASETWTLLKADIAKLEAFM